MKVVEELVMTQTHFLPQTIKTEETGVERVQVFFSTRPNRKAVLFIHGYSGHALKTWSDFPDLLPSCPKCAGTDIYFYGYDGLKAPIGGSAAIFRAFLEKLMGKTQQFLSTRLPPGVVRPNGFTYDELVIVAHSLGAVIIRRALLQATQKKESWVSKTTMVLYAPAHRGASVVNLALEAFEGVPFLRFFGAIARFRSPLINQLRDDSRVLKDLLEQTIAALKHGRNTHLVARRVVIGSYDRVIPDDIQFANDPPPDAVPGATHTSVCKPRHGFMQPFRYLEEIL